MRASLTDLGASFCQEKGGGKGGRGGGKKGGGRQLPFFAGAMKSPMDGKRGRSPQSFFGWAAFNKKTKEGKKGGWRLFYRL